MNSPSTPRWWQRVFAALAKVFSRSKKDALAHRAGDPDIPAEVQNMIMRMIYRSDRDHRAMLHWRRIALVFLSIFLLFTWVNWRERMEQGLRIEQKPYRTVSINGSWGTAHVAIIPIRGTIDGDPLGPTEVSNTPRYLRETLKLAKEEGNLAAVVIYLDSGGGDLYASAESYRLVHDFAKKMKIPVYAYVPRTAFSGAYYIALGADEIIADPVAEVGNIGVIVNRFNTYGFGRRFGIQMDSIKTGQHKDAGGQWKKPNAKDRAIDQRVVDVMFEGFLGAVSESRTAYTFEELKKESKKVGGVTSGAWFVASDALDKKLIDKVLTFEEFLTYVATTIESKDGHKFRNVEFVKYDEKLSILDDWKLRFKKTESSHSSSAASAPQKLGACVLANEILDRITGDE